MEKTIGLTEESINERFEKLGLTEESINERFEKLGLTEESINERFEKIQWELVDGVPRIKREPPLDTTGITIGWRIAPGII